MSKAAAPGAVLIATLIGLLVDVDSTAAALLLVIAVLLASLTGLSSGLVAAVLGAVSLNYFFIEPEHELVLFGKRDDALALATFIVVAVVEAVLLHRIRTASTAAVAADDRAVEAVAEAAASARRAALFASIGHDLRTPLAGIRAAADVLGAPEPPPIDVRDRLRSAISDEAARLERVLDRILQVGRLDAGRVELTREPVDVLGVIQTCLRRAGRDVPVTVDIDEPDPPLHVDVVLFEQLVRNLIDNAIEHGDGTAIEIVGRPVDDRRYELRVVDHGPGVPQGLQDTMFEPFRTSRHRDDQRGAGLGLAIVSAIAAAHDGSIEWQPTPGGGATFRLVVTTT